MTVLRLFSLLCIVALIACNKDEDNEPADPLFDSWEVVSGTGSVANEQIGTLYTFASDGGFTATKDGATQVGTYTRTDTELVLDFGNSSATYFYDILGDRMSWASTLTATTLTLQRR